MKRIIPTADQKQKVIALYTLGNMTYREIANHFPFSYKIVNRIIKEEGITPRTRTMRPEFRVKVSRAWDMQDDIIRMYQSGQSAREIAKKVGCSHRPICDILIEVGEMRTLKEAWVHRKAKAKAKPKAKPKPHTIKREAGLEDVQVSTREGVASLREQGLTIDQIAELKGMTRLEVYKELSQ